MSKRKSKAFRIADYPFWLRGLATNRYGGNQLQHEKGFLGCRPTPAGRVIIYSEEDKRAYEQQMGIGENIESDREKGRAPQDVNLPFIAHGPKRIRYIREWIGTDGPTSAQDLRDLKSALLLKSRFGFYSAGIYYVGPERSVQNQRTRVSGPYRDLHLLPSYIPFLHQALEIIENDRMFRRDDPSKQKRPMFR